MNASQTGTSGLHPLKRWWSNKLLITAFASSMLIAVFLVAGGYDLVKRALDPCSRLEERLAEVKTKFDLIKGKVEVSYGEQQAETTDKRQKFIEMQMKSCCIAFQSDKLDQNGFLQCQKEVERIDKQTDERIELISKAETATTAEERETLFNDYQKLTDSMTRRVNEQIEKLVGETLQVRAQQHIQQGMTFVSLAKHDLSKTSESYDNAIGEFTEAIVTSEKMEKLGMPCYAEAYMNRGVAYMMQEKPNKAINDLHKAAQCSPWSPMGYYNLAAYYSLRQQHDLAFDMLDVTLRLGFNNCEALRSDPDLKSIRDRQKEFRHVLEKYRMFCLR
ncbi:MAG: tetratricopeptide repeat protein [Gammaproteobacteria bacterium]